MENDATEIAVPPLHGEIPAALGIGAAIRIPIPATHGLAVEFRPAVANSMAAKRGHHVEHPFPGPHGSQASQA